MLDKAVSPSLIVLQCCSMLARLQVISIMLGFSLFIKTSQDTYHYKPLRQYWKHLRQPESKTREVSKRWLPFVHKHLTQHLIRCYFKDMASILHILQGMKDSILFNYKSCTVTEQGHRLILAAACLGSRNNAFIKKYSVTISTDNKLRMNLTLIELKLSGAPLCLTGDRNIMLEYMSITQYNNTIPEHLTELPPVGATQSYHGYRYDLLCGQYPAHVRFLLYPRTTIELIQKHNLNHKITMFYQVIDSEFADSFDFTCFWIRCSQKVPYTYIYKPRPYTEEILSLVISRWPYHKYHSLRLVTDPSNTFVISMLSTAQITIFDGPLFECEIIRSNQGKVFKRIKKIWAWVYILKTTSFLATILFVSDNQQFEFESVSVDKRTIHILNDIRSIPKSVIFPWKTCRGKYLQFCVLKIPNPTLHGINVTIPSVWYSGPSLPGADCSFGGITVYFKNTGVTSLQEMMQECNNVENVGLNLFSSKNTEEIWISTISFRAYSKIKAEVMISTTPCRGIHFQPTPYKDCQYHASKLDKKPIVINANVYYYISIHDNKILTNFWHSYKTDSKRFR